MLPSKMFRQKLKPLEQEAFDCMKLVIENFLGNKRAANYKELITNMLNSFEKIKVSMSLKLHLLHQHVDWFKENNGKVSDEQGERFHQQIKRIEDRFHGRPVENMLAEFVWYTFEEDDNDAEKAGAVKFIRTDEPKRLRRSETESSHE